MSKLLNKVVATLLTAATVLTIGATLPKKTVNAAGATSYAAKVATVAYGEVDKVYQNKKTTYAQYFDNLRNSGLKWYNGCKNGYDWCDVFVDWCFVQAYGYSEAQSMTYQCENSCGAGCVYSARYYGYNGSRSDNKHFISGAKTPSIGDQIFFYRSGEFTDAHAHTGLVVGVHDGRVYTVEGNTRNSAGQNCVSMKDYAIGDSSIVGYGRPQFNTFVSSKQSAFVDRLYTKGLDRQPDNGKYSWLTLIQNGKSSAGQVAWGIFSSVEFTNKRLSNTEYVKHLYRALLGREADSGGLQYWVGCLNAGTSRYNVFRGIANSAEFRNYCDANGLIWRQI